MDKLDMQTKNITNENIDFIESGFPNAIVETKDDNGKIIKKIDFDILRQELSTNLIEGNAERYAMTWPGKGEAILNSNRPIRKTLRPCKEDSVDFDFTENIYIEGDNLDALKLLRETYLGKIKTIYIDPPYNTGNDFIYNDDFSESLDEYLRKTNQVDNQGRQMVQNLETGGHIHSDWLSMMYPRLKIAKDLLTFDGVIFISIDDNEVMNLRKLCDEIFGQQNFVANFIRKTSSGEKTAKPNVNKHHDYTLCYAKSLETIQDNDVINGEKKQFGNYSNPDHDPNGPWTKDSLLIKIDNNRYGFARYPITNPYTREVYYPPVYYDEKQRKQWHYVESTFREMEKRGQVVYYKSKSDYSGEYGFYIKKYQKDSSKIFSNVSTLFSTDNSYTNSNGTNDISKVFGDKVFANTYPKPVKLIKKLIEYTTQNDPDAYVLDFFSGTATTAQAVMELNAEDGGHRKFIMVQIPELSSENQGASKAGYSNICEIGKERIRRSGKQILDGNASLKGKLDVGFRDFIIDSSNMKDVYYNPEDYTQDLLINLENNIKEDRNSFDLLFQVMLELGITLDSKISEKIIDNKKVYYVKESDDEIQPNVVCCFDNDITEEVVIEIAKLKPVHVVFRDDSLANDNVSINFDQIFETYSPNTDRKIL